MIDRVVTIDYTRSSGARVKLALDKYENEPDFQSFALTRFVDPHDPSFASFAGFDVRSELIELLEGQFSDEASEFPEARRSLIAGFDAI